MNRQLYMELTVILKLLIRVHNGIRIAARLCMNIVITALLCRFSARRVSPLAHESAH